MKKSTVLLQRKNDTLSGRGRFRTVGKFSTVEAAMAFLQHTFNVLAERHRDNPEKLFALCEAIDDHRIVAEDGAVVRTSLHQKLCAAVTGRAGTSTKLI